MENINIYGLLLIIIIIIVGLNSIDKRIMAITGFTLMIIGLLGTFIFGINNLCSTMMISGGIAVGISGKKLL
ncbi:hypothetical protein [Candidatus Vampirococcus lugosii]|uniref:hypothetical protein n=1 Tax=Candidatus Vampirococcus lugosii TaxID=2789015 RepID=UPI001BD11134|nr:hypothetical protein [Candidatus Vampirococcus lugosii]